MANQSLLISKYDITSDTSWLDKKYNLTPEIQQILEEIFPGVERGKQSTINKLKKYARRYPHVPHFKNYLEKAYEQAGKTKKAREINRWTMEEHPDYLFGKLNYAGFLIRDGQHERVPEILGEELDLKALYPERDTFHFREVLGFFSTCMQYYLAIDDRDSARQCMDIMDEIGPGEQATEAAHYYWMRKNMEDASRRLQEEQERRRMVESRSYDQSVQTSAPPEFTYPEIEILYENDMRIEHHKVRNILELPRETLIADLEKVVEDSIRRYEHFREINIRMEYWDEERFSFVMHALFLLTELKAEDSLEVVLRLLRQGQELLDFWFADTLGEILWEVLYVLGQNQLDQLGAFMKEPDNFTYARTPVVTAVSQLALHRPERRREVLDWFDDLFRFYLANEEDDRLIDTDLISLMVWGCLDFNAGELEGTVRELYRQGLVEPNVVGEEKEVITDLNADDYKMEPRPVPDNIIERYDTFVKTWYDNSWQDTANSTDDVNPQDNQNSLFASLLQNQPYQTAEEPGRNDPCPCGSGKKYKYCCMG